MALRYFTPTRQEYQSSFVPLPVDFIERQMQRKEQGIGQARTYMNEMEDIYGGIETRPVEVGQKNELIQGTFGDVRDLVKEKYGNDYSAALPEIQRRMAKFRRDPFWSASAKAMQDQQVNDRIRAELAYQGKLLEGPVDPRTQPIRKNEETGQYDIPDFNRSLMERGDWEGYLDPFVRKLASNVVEGMPANIRSGPARGQYLQQLVQKGVPTEQLSKYISDDVVEGFLDANESFVFAHGRDKQAAKDFILNELKTRVPASLNRNFMTNRGFNTSPNEREQGLIPAYIHGTPDMFGSVQKEVEKTGGTGENVPELQLTGREGAVQHLASLLRKDFDKINTVTDMPEAKIHEAKKHIIETYGEDGWKQTYELADENLEEQFTRVGLLPSEESRTTRERNEQANLLAGVYEIIPITGVKKLGRSTNYDNLLKSFKGEEAEQFKDNLRFVGKDLSGVMSAGGDVWVSRVGTGKGAKTIRFVAKKESNNPILNLRHKIESQMIDPAVRLLGETEPVDIGITDVKVYKKFSPEYGTGIYTDDEYVLVYPDGREESQTPEEFAKNFRYEFQ